MTTILMHGNHDALFSFYATKAEAGAPRDCVLYACDLLGVPA